eukprot:SAG22_NODE_1877_length_3383_cov_2.067905_2_plen_161_part_00
MAAARRSSDPAPPPANPVNPLATPPGTVHSRDSSVDSVGDAGGGGGGGGEARRFDELEVSSVGDHEKEEASLMKHTHFRTVKGQGGALVLSDRYLAASGSSSHAHGAAGEMKASMAAVIAARTSRPPPDIRITPSNERAWEWFKELGETERHCLCLMLPL